MASSPPQHPQLMWSNLGVDDNQQKEVLTQLAALSVFNGENFLAVFEKAGLLLKLADFQPAHFKSMFDPEYLKSLGGNNQDDIKKLQALAEDVSRFATQLGGTHAGETLIQAWKNEKSSQYQPPTVTSESVENTPQVPPQGPAGAPAQSSHHASQFHNLGKDVTMGDDSPQPPDDWPPADGSSDMEKYKNENSPLTWPFTEEQNKRKLKWLQRIRNTPAEKINLLNFVRSLVMTDIIRRDWYMKPELNRKPKLKDVMHLIHPDKAIAPFQKEAGKYDMSWEEIQKLHTDAFNKVQGLVGELKKIGEKDFQSVLCHVDGFHQNAIYNEESIAEDSDSDDDEEDQTQDPCDSEVMRFHKDFHCNKMYDVIKRAHQQVVERNSHENFSVKFERLEAIPITSEISALNQELRAYNDQNKLEPRTGQFPWEDMVAAWRVYNTASSEESKKRGKNLIDKQWRLHQFPSNWKSIPPKPKGSYPKLNEMHKAYIAEYDCDPKTGKPHRQTSALDIPATFPNPLNLNELPQSAFPQPSPTFQSMPQPQKYLAAPQPYSQAMIPYQKRMLRPDNRSQVLISSEEVDRKIRPGFTQDGDPIVAVSNSDADPSEGQHTYVVHVKGTNQHVIMSENECGGPGVWDPEIPVIKKDAAKAFAKLKYKKSWVRGKHGVKWIAIGKAAAQAKSKPLMVCKFYWTCPDTGNLLEWIMYRTECEKIITEQGFRSLFCDMIEKAYGWRPEGIEEALQKLQNVTVLKRQPQQYKPASSDALMPWHSGLATQGMVDAFAGMNLAQQQADLNFRGPAPSQPMPSTAYPPNSQVNPSNTKPYQQPQSLQSVPQQQYWSQPQYGYQSQPANELQLFQHAQGPSWVSQQQSGPQPFFGHQTQLSNNFIQPQILNSPWGGWRVPSSAFGQPQFTQTWNSASPFIFNTAANMPGVSQALITGHSQQSAVGPQAYGQPAQGQPAYGQLTQGQPAQAQLAYGQPAQVQLTQGQPAQVQLNQGQPAQAQLAYGQPAQAQLTQGQPAQVQLNQGQPAQAQLTYGQPAQAQLNQGQPAQAQLTYGQPAQGQPAHGQLIQGQPAQGLPLITLPGGHQAGLPANRYLSPVATSPAQVSVLAY